MLNEFKNMIGIQRPVLHISIREYSVFKKTFWFSFSVSDGGPKTPVLKATKEIGTTGTF